MSDHAELIRNTAQALLETLEDCGLHQDVIGMARDLRDAASQLAGPAREPQTWQAKAVGALMACLPISEAHGYCFCDGPDRIARHLDWCPDLILSKFRDRLAAPSPSPTTEPQG
jgi:hypothetical protein